MKIYLYACFFCLLALAACGEGKPVGDKSPEEVTTAPVDASNDWKFGIALWTFHTFNFPEALAKVDSAGLTYIEPNTFHQAGPGLKDSLILQLSPAGLDRLRGLIDEKGQKAESVYLVGDTTVQSWKRQFEIAKRLGAKFVTAEPPPSLWDSVDSLAGAFGMKVAIHEHWKGTSHYWHPDSVLAAIEGHPNFGACADLGHWPKSGIVPLEAVKKLSGHIIGVHLKDIAAYDDPELKDVPVGTGVVDFPAIFEELKKQRFNGHIYIERDAEDQPSNLHSVMQTIEYYNEQIRQLQ